MPTQINFAYLEHEASVGASLGFSLKPRKGLLGRFQQWVWDKLPKRQNFEVVKKYTFTEEHEKDIITKVMSQINHLQLRNLKLESFIILCGSRQFAEICSNEDIIAHAIVFPQSLAFRVGHQTTLFGLPLCVSPNFDGLAVVPRISLL